ADEGGFRGALDHAVERLENVLPRREAPRFAEPPGAVALELTPALVFLVVRLPEGLGVGDMDRDRHPQLAAAFPDRIELRIIHLDQLPPAVAQVQAEPLELLQPGGAQAVAFFDLPHCAYGPVGVVPALAVE